ncbi:hypothetical protein FEM33_01585 [Dyadobacter flavalbus]|uniref:Uncharacterized protein n=1 Tax=Dyadobacter flavalbus TaxID=2579942 RepID=A0A5M8R5M4_9BACT|nr:heparin lyase I family protein [Dyadobacter flavalbus]KAA6441452.1 hypothetical protein FEM33_01585 [Dyadobacter flavalbus]
MRSILLSLLVLLSWTAEAQLIGGGRRGVVIFQGGGGGDSTGAPLTSTRIATALGYMPLNPNVPIDNPVVVKSIARNKVIGIELVDNTPDLQKPVSYPQADALALKINRNSLATINLVNIESGGNISLATPDASSITSGVFADARIGSNITRNTGTATITNKTISGLTNTIKDLAESAMPTLATTLAGKMPTFTPLVINGVSVTAGGTLSLATTSANSILSGVFDDARIPANVLRATGAAVVSGKTFDETNTFTSIPYSVLTGAPTIPSSTNFLTTTGDQSGIAGNKTTTGTWAFNAPPTIAGANLSGDILFSGNLTRKVGAPSAAASDIYSRYFGRNGSVVIGPSTGNADLTFQMGASGANVGAFRANTGNLHLFPNGATPVDSIYRLHVRGKVKITDIMNVTVPTYETDAEAMAGTPPLIAGDVYMNSQGMLHAVKPVSDFPEYDLYTSSGKDVPFDYADNIGEVVWRTQTPNQPYSLNFVTNRNRPMFRVELQPGDNFLSDVTSKNSQNPKYDATNPDRDEEGEYQVKERSEGYTKDFPSVGGTYYYISYSFMVEPGPDVYYSNPDYFCYLGQWHNSDSDKGPVPFAFNFSGQDKLQLQIREFTNTATQFKTKATLKPRGQWNSMVIRVKYNTSSTATKNGEFTWWVNEQIQDNLTGLDLGSLLKPDGSGGFVTQTNKGYWKSGIYRTAGSPDTSPGVPSTTAPRVNLAVQYANIRVTTTNLTAAPNNKITSPDPITP